MFLTLTALRTELLYRLKSNSNILSASRLNQWLNQAQDDVANEFDFKQFMIRRSFTATTTGVDNRTYYVPDISCNKLRRIYNQTQNLDLALSSKDEILNEDPSEQNTGTPDQYAIEGYGYILTQKLSTSDVISVVSTSISDTSQTVLIKGLLSTGLETYESLTLNGTTPTAGSVAFSEIYSVVKSANTTGTVTITAADANTTVVSKLGPLDSVRETIKLYLYATPTSADSYIVEGYRRPRLMVNDYDFPDFPSNYHELILLGGLIRGHNDLYRANLASDVMKNEFLPKLAQLKRDETPRNRKSPVLIGTGLRYKTIGRLPSNYPDR